MASNAIHSKITVNQTLVRRNSQPDSQHLGFKKTLKLASNFFARIFGSSKLEISGHCENRAFETFTQPNTNNEELKESQKEELRREVLDHYGISFTCFQRRYPSYIPGDDQNRSKPLLKTVNEIEALTKKLRQFHNPPTPSPQPIKSTYRHKTEELLAIIGKVFPELRNLSLKFLPSNCYSDTDIMHVHKIIPPEDLERLTIQYTEHGNPIIQQQATRGWPAAVTAMLIYENNKKINHSLIRVYLDFMLTIEMEADIERANLIPLTSKCNSLEELQQLLKENGSAIVIVCVGGRDHGVIVDAITDRSIRIRDPYHGWEVDIKREAFENSLFYRGPTRLNGVMVMQVQKPFHLDDNELQNEKLQLMNDLSIF